MFEQEHRKQWDKDIVEYNVSYLFGQPEHFSHLYTKYKGSLTNKSRDYNQKVFFPKFKVEGKIYRYTSSCYDEVKDSRGKVVSHVPSVRFNPTEAGTVRQDVQYTMLTIERMLENDKLKLTLLTCVDPDSIQDPFKPSTVKNWFTELQKYYVSQFKKEK